MKPSSKHAIKILESMREQLDSNYLAYWVLPNTILTFSGARAFCDGVFWDDDKKGLLGSWDEEIAKSAAVLKKCTPLIFLNTGIQEPRTLEKCATFDVVFENGLRYMLTQTKLLHNVTIEKLKKYKTESTLAEFIRSNLKSQNKFKNNSHENLGHITFGILLGYPDKAILESVLVWEKENDEFPEKLIDADIRGADYYICPQPVYSYPRHIANDKDIIAHEKLWSGILKDYYTSEFHKSLAADKSFSRKMRELGNLY